MATYQSEMLDFSYDVALHIEHTSIALDLISSTLGIEPNKSHQCGERRSTPDVQVLEGTYPFNYWSCELPTIDQQDLTEFMREFVTQFHPHREFLSHIAHSGGCICLFVGLFSDRCCAHEFDNQLLTDLAGLGINLRLDFYGINQSQKT